jgi:hypothetical protein
LGPEFALKHLGYLHFFLGIEVKKIGDVIQLSKGKYAIDLLSRVGMQNCKPSTPLSSSESLSLTKEELMNQEDTTGTEA